MPKIFEKFDQLTKQVDNLEKISKLLSCEFESPIQENLKEIRFPVQLALTEARARLDRFMFDRECRQTRIKRNKQI